MEIRHNTYNYILIISGIIVLLPFIYVCQLVHPVNDDYYYAIEHLQTNCVDSVVKSYMTWSGRYFATFISSLNPLSITEDKEWLFKAYSFILILFACCATLLSFILFFKDKLCRKDTYALSSLFLIVLFFLCPSISEGFYWFSAYVSYTVVSILSLLFFALATRNGAISNALLYVLALIIPGGNEITAVLFVGSLIYLSFTYREKRFFISTMLACIGLAIMIASPGNSVRMTGQLSSTPYLWTIGVSTMQSILWLFIWLPALLLVSLIYIPLYGMKIAKSECFNVSIKRFALFAAMIVFLAHIPPTLGLSSVVIARTANSLLLYYALFYFFGLNIILNRYSERINSIFSKEYSSIILPTALFSFLFLCPFSINSNIATAYTDIISGKARHYDEIRIQRDKMAQSNKNKNITLKFPALGITSRTLFAKDLETNSEECFCDAYRRYHKLKCKVEVEKDDIRFPSNYDTLLSLGKKSR